MILKNKTGQAIHVLLKRDGKMVTAVVPAKDHSQEFPNSELNQDILDKVNRKYLLIFENTLPEVNIKPRMTHVQTSSQKEEESLQATLPPEVSATIEHVAVSVDIGNTDVSKKRRQRR